MKILFYFTFIFISRNSFAQAIIDCSSQRFDQEVFSSVTTTLNIQYGSNIDANGANTLLTLDVYEPAGDTMLQRPLIIWAHGGSFLSGTKNDIDVVALSQHFAKRGYVCVSINYRLGIPFPVNQSSAMRAVYRAVQDMKSAVRFFRKDAFSTNQYKIDPDLIFAGGSSAGAFTALHLAYMDSYDELPLQIDTSLLGDLEGNSGNPGFSSEVNAVIDLCGALGDKTWLHSGDIPFVAMHGDIDGTVPYGTSIIYLLGSFPLMVVDGSHSITEYSLSLGFQNEMYTYFNADHVPYVMNTSYMDTTVRFVSNFLYRYLGCNPSDPTPIANTFTTNIKSEELISKVSVYPNPSSGKIWIELNDQQNRIVSVSLQDISGRSIIQNNSFENPLFTESLVDGMYLLKIETVTGKIVKKVVIKK